MVGAKKIIRARVREAHDVDGPDIFVDERMIRFAVGMPVVSMTKDYLFLGLIELHQDLTK